MNKNNTLLMIKYRSENFLLTWEKSYWVNECVIVQLNIFPDENKLSFHYVMIYLFILDAYLDCIVLNHWTNMN